MTSGSAANGGIPAAFCRERPPRRSAPRDIAKTLPQCGKSVAGSGRAMLELSTFAFGCLRPVSIVYPAEVCVRSSCVTERTMFSRWACWASLGNSSLNCTPGKRVAIGDSSPRIPAGACGFGSNVSICGGPPIKNSSKQRFARPNVGSAASSPATICRGNPRLNPPSAPTSRNRRRERLSHSFRALACTENMAALRFSSIPRRAIAPLFR